MLPPPHNKGLLLQVLYITGIKVEDVVLALHDLALIQHSEDGLYLGVDQDLLHTHRLHSRYCIGDSA